MPTGRRLWPCLCAFALLTCGDAKRLPSTQTPAPPAKPTLRLLAMTDLSGYLEPCGCQSRPLGGIDKAAAQLRELRADGVATVFVAAGNLLFAAESTADPRLDGGDTEMALQQRWQAETLTEILGRLALTTAAPGPADLRFGAGELLALARRGGFPLLAAKFPAKVSGEPAQTARAPSTPTGSDAAELRSSVVIGSGRDRIGLWGLSALDGAVAGDPSEFVAEAQRLSDAVRAEGAGLVIGLLAADARTARRVAGTVHGLDFLVRGGNDSPAQHPPERIGATTLLSAAHRGHGLLVVDIAHTGAGPLSDQSPWTRQAHGQALRQRADELAARIAEWRRDPKVDRALVAEQEARLAQIQRELATAATPHASDNWFSARFIELGPEAPSDAEVRGLIDAFDRRINEHTREALAHVLPKPVAKGQPAYVGSQRCGDCHESAFAWWRKHDHGRAYATLEKRNAQFNLGCVGCHVTGYNQPGGSTVVHNQGLTDVGCESCHGPGSLHAGNPDVDEAKNVRRDVPQNVCVHCHNPDHSDRFEYAKYKAKLIVKGHGLPSEQAP